MHEINSKPIVSQPLPESHKCPNCVREFTSEHALLKHLEDHQNDKFNVSQLSVPTLDQEPIY